MEQIILCNVPTTVHGGVPGSQRAFSERPSQLKYFHCLTHPPVYAPPTQTAAFPCLLTAEIKGQ